MSHPADSLSARSDNVSPGTQPLCLVRHCLTRQTASLAGQTMSDPAHNLSEPANTRQIVRCLRMLTHARSYLNPRGSLRVRSIDRLDRQSIGDPLGLDRSTRSKVDRGSLRARSIARLDRKSIGDPLGLDRSIDSIESRSGIP